MKARKILSFLLTLVIVISLGCNTYASAIPKSKTLTGFDSVFNWFPNIKKLNNDEEVKLINKEVKISENSSIVFDAVFMDKYSTLVLYTVKNQTDNRAIGYVPIVANNLKGIDKDYGGRLQTYISNADSNRDSKNASVFYGKPKENDTTIKISIEVMDYGTKHVDLAIDKANIIENDLEKEIKDEVKIEDQMLKLDKIYLSPIMCYMFVECEGEKQQVDKPSIDGLQLFADGQCVNGFMKKHDDDNCNKMEKLYIRFLPISFETKELVVKYKDYQKKLVINEDFNKSKTDIESDKCIVNKYVEKKIDPAKFSIKDKTGIKDYDNGHEVGFLSSSCNASYCINANKGDTITINYTLVCNKGDISMNLLDPNKKNIAVIDKNSKGRVTIEAKEFGSYYIEIKTLEDSGFYFDINW